MARERPIAAEQTAIGAPGKDILLGAAAPDLKKRFLGKRIWKE
jgi:hypothetical protein